MELTNILFERQDAVATLTLNKPEVHNALDDVMISELAGAYTELSADDAVRVVVLKGAGKSFCAGADLEWMGRVARYSRDENLEDSRKLQRMFAAIAECPKATIVRVHGSALGGGAGLVAACDIAIAGHETSFGFTEARLGLAPAVISPYVIEKIGIGAARALFVTGEKFGADVALRIGLVQQVEAFRLESAVQKTVEAVLQAGPVAVAAIKSLLREIAGRTPSEAAEATVHCIAGLRAGAEGQEGIAAFLAKRSPSFEVYSG